MEKVLTEEEQTNLLLLRMLETMEQMTGTIALLMSEPIYKSATTNENPITYTYTFTQTVNGVERKVTYKFVLGENNQLIFQSADIADDKN